MFDRRKSRVPKRWMVATAIGFGMKTLIQISAVVCTAGLAHGQSPCSYTVQIMPEMDCGSFQGPIPPVAINNSGVVIFVGDDCGDGDARSFWWHEGLKDLQPIPLPPGILALRANDISDAGLIVGELEGLIGQLGFIFDLNTQQFIAQIPPATPNGECGLSGINDNGWACGWRKTDAGDPSTSTAFIYEIATGELTDLGTLGGISSSAGFINDDGVVTGLVRIDGLPHPFVWQDGKVEVIDILSEWYPTTNDNGVVVGALVILIPEWPNQRAHAFSWQNGKITELGMLPGDTDSSAIDINESGVILGHSTHWTMKEFTHHAVIWVEGMLYELTDLIVGMPSNTVIDTVSAINNSGQIVGYSFTPGTANDVATVLLTPIATPGDITGNCAVDVDDLLRVINEWGDSNSTADLDESGIVDVPDLMIVIENWTSFQSVSTSAPAWKAKTGRSA